MKTVILLNGSPRSGKWTFVETMENYFIGKVIVESYSTIDKIKLLAEEYYSWTGSKTEKDRDLLSELKDLATNYNDLPCKWVIAESNKFFEFIDSEGGLFEKSNGIFSIDVREPGEIATLDKHFHDIKDINCISIFIENTAAEAVKFKNTGDKDITKDKYPYHYIIQNNDTKEIYKKSIVNFCKNVLGGTF